MKENVEAAHAAIFVVQEHHTDYRHYVFRLEVGGVLKSWAVQREPAMDPAVRRLAIEVEDHPLCYASFEGEVDEGEFGAGRLTIWDRGTYDNVFAGKDPPKSMEQALRDGHAEVDLHGERLNGKFALIRIPFSGKRKNWILIKIKDSKARPSIVNLRV